MRLHLLLNTPLYQRFNSRTRVGCDRTQPVNTAAFTSFNSRTRVGCDCVALNQCTPTYVSIHAPAWGATNGIYDSFKNFKFQFTHPRGVRRNIKHIVVSQYGFQFTHPRGVRHWVSRALSSSFRFQFTHPRGVRRRLQPLLQQR